MKSLLTYSLLLYSTLTLANTPVQVEGRGDTEAQAKQDAYTTACEQVVGQVVVSDRESNGNKLTKDWVGAYCAGYITNEEILETRREDNGYAVKMNVSVASSKIAKRMMLSGNNTHILEGQRLQTQIDSRLDQLNKGDSLLVGVLSSYPYNAFVVNSGETEISIGSRRELTVDIPFEIKWSRYWLEALDESLELVSIDSKTRLSMLTKSLPDLPYSRSSDFTMSYTKLDDLFERKHSFSFNDKQTLELVNRQLQTPTGQQHIGLRVELKDTGGNILDTRCEKIKTDELITYVEPQSEVMHWNDMQRNLRPSINGNGRIAKKLRVHLRVKEQIGGISRVTLTVDKTCT